MRFLLLRAVDIFFANFIRKRFIQHLFKYHIHLNCDCAEFGVYKGTTAKYISSETDKTLFLFDSFDGLPENWGKCFKQGDFKLNKIPNLPLKSVLYKGQFNFSITNFKKDWKNKPLAFIHIDSDLYSSAKDVLFRLNENIVPGTVILFDEFLKGENIALKEWIGAYSRNCIFIKKTIHLQTAYRVVR